MYSGPLISLFFTCEQDFFGSLVLLNCYFANTFIKIIPFHQSVLLKNVLKWYYKIMCKSLTWAAALVGGLGIGIVIAVLLVERYGTFCPVCGGKLGTEKGSIICTSCGVRMRVEEL